MKEAAGEANITVITIVLIAIVLAVGTIIVRNVLSNTDRSTACNSAGGVWQDGHCWAAGSCDNDGNCAGAQLDCEENDEGNMVCQ